MTAAAARSLFAPEVIQSSAMDCGPASLKSLLAGFGIDVGYGRLREACSTDVDGTSIDTLEDIAVGLGLDASQMMVPFDHLLLAETQVIPAIVVVQRPHSGTHFIVVWRVLGGFVQVMDPAVGRRWVRASALLREVHRHEMPIDADAWRQHASTDEFRLPLAKRLSALGIARRLAFELIAEAERDPTWRAVASLDATTRLLTRLSAASGLDSTEQIVAVLRHLTFEAEGARLIPDEYWSVRAADPSEGGEEQVRIRGAVLIRAGGRLGGARRENDAATRSEPTPLSSLRSAPVTPWGPLLDGLRGAGISLGGVVVAALAVAAATVLVQALLLRGALDIGYWVGAGRHRVGAFGVIVTFLVGVLLLEIPIAIILARIGRKLEVHLRVAFQSKIPRIADQYFHSRLLSDMAERLHSVPLLRSLPSAAGSWLRNAFLLLFTVAGIVWLAPWLLPWLLVSTASTLLLSLASLPVLQERDMRMRSHGATLIRFYLDALQGIAAVRAHGAGKSLLREQESILVHWGSAARRLQGTTVNVEALQALVGVATAVVLVTEQVAREGTTGSVLLVTYWSLQIPVLAQALAVAARQLPAIRNVLVRLLEPLGAPEEADGDARAPALTPPGPPPPAARDEEQISRGQHARPTALVPVGVKREGVGIEFRDVAVRVGGHSLLDAVHLRIEPGSQLAIVGESGAGKSSLIGLLLGWHRAASGSVILDGKPLTAGDLGYWRMRTAWVDPAVQLFNRRLVQNVLYGSEGGVTEIARAIEASELKEVVERLPEGMQTVLGEGGALVSGGEGQRVRLARAWLRTDVRLVLLDEPFRGLDREKRTAMLARARESWNGATLIFATHDIRDTLAFERVLVVHRGRIVEDGDPAVLACDASSRYHSMLASEKFVHERLWGSPQWRRFRVAGGLLTERARQDWVDAPELPREASAEGMDD